jgi:hypothetical protein
MSLSSPHSFPCTTKDSVFINNTTVIATSFNSHSIIILKPITRNFLKISYSYPFSCSYSFSWFCC